MYLPNQKEEIGIPSIFYSSPLRPNGGFGLVLTEIVYNY